VIEEITLTEHIAEMWILFSMHREELATNKELMVLKPDWDSYRFLEKSGKLMTLAVRDNGVIVGYTVTVIYKNMHYSDLIDAFVDVLYLHPKRRKGSLGIRLIRKTEEEARKRGAKRLMLHGKPDTVFALLMPKLEYCVQDIVFGKVL
jgi:GNAT superfamily N-acetyltransferase